MEPSNAIEKASGIKARIFARSKCGSTGAGKPSGTPPNRVPMVATSRWRNPVRAAETMTAISMAGHVGRSRRRPRMMMSAIPDRPTVTGFTVSIAAHRARSFGRNAAGSVTTSSPSSSLI